MKRLRVLFFCLGGALALSACSSNDGVPQQPLRSDVVEAYEASGLSEDVSSCVVGLGERQVELRDLDPSTPTEDRVQVLIDEIVSNCVDAEQLGNPDFDLGPSLAFASEPDVFGDDHKLDELWLRCEGGDGAACDELWETAPIGSSYETFGVTCGERFDVLDCSEELELPDGVIIDLTVLDSEESATDDEVADEPEADTGEDEDDPTKVNS